MFFSFSCSTASRPGPLETSAVPSHLARRWDQDVARTHLLFGLAILGFSLFLFDLNYVVTELALDNVADLSGLQGERGLIKFSNHLTSPEPAQVSALVLAAWIG